MARLRAVLGVARSISDSRDEGELLDLVAASVCEHLGFGRCIIYILEPDSNFRMRSSASLPGAAAVSLPEGYAIPYSAYLRVAEAGERIGEVVYLDGRSPRLADPEIAPYFISTPASAEGSGAWHPASLLFVPLTGEGGRVIGLLNPDDPLDGSLPGPDSALVLESFASLSSVALKLVRAKSEAAARMRILEAQRQQVARLFEASTTLQREIQLDTMLSEMVRTMAEAGGFARVGLMLLDAGSSRLRVRATYGISPEQVQHLMDHELDLEDFAPMMRQEARVSRSYLIDHTRFPIPEELVAALSVPDVRPDWKPGMWHPLDSLTIPLYDDEGGLLGLISIDEPANGLFPEVYHVEALEYFADQCANAVSQVTRFRRLESLAHTDALTRLPNRATFTARMVRSLTECMVRNLPVSLLFVDLDHFKEVNDSFGHLNGDLVLRAVARRLRTSLRKGDLIGRYGGEEFVILLPETPLPGALATAEKLRKRIEGHTAGLAEDGHLRATISIGVATTADLDASVSTDPGEAAELLMALADSALYQAKAGGRNRVSHDFSLHGRHLDRIPAPNAAAGESLA
ncbi:MAG: sensor domain-containing diguanylate cyclase [Nitrospiraceae bacterium]|nr:sensor domain-containing diguanylate cyclase [Nitrospiraceae bacterium]